jgi:transcriptional antiterminator NusG
MSDQTHQSRELPGEPMLDSSSTPPPAEGAAVPSETDPTAEDLTAEDPTAEDPTAEDLAVEDSGARSAAAESEPVVDDSAAEAFSADETAEDETPAEEPDLGDAIELTMPEDDEERADESKQDWFILKVQSNRENTVVEALRRRIAMAGLDDFFGDIIVPIEKVTEFKGGKKRVVKRKLYPGYIMIHMQITDETWFMVRDTTGIGDFTGAAGKPIPMQPHEISRLLVTQEEKTEEAPKLSIGFKVGDKVKINEGTFENFEGEVETIDEANGRISVVINIFGRSTPVENLEYWQVEAV